MAGVRYLLQQRMRFEIPTDTPGSTSVVFPLAGVGINTLGAVSGVLEVITYDRTLNGGVTASVKLVNMVRTADGKLATQESGEVASVPLTTTDSNTRLLTAELTAPIGSMVGAALEFTTGQSPGSGDVELEVYLAVRSA